MFIGAMLDCFPEWADSMPAVLSQAGFGNLVELDCQDISDGVLKGTQFRVRPAGASAHEHRHLADIERIIRGSDLDREVQEIALGVFDLLGRAEARVHGVDIQDVAFHEVGAWDSIADIICAAWLIDRVQAGSWSVSGVPLGGGRVRTAHGEMPVPAPATTLLLEGFECFDDGIEGERVTPTGAAILAYLGPDRINPGGILQGTGMGFGEKTFPGLSNMLRVTTFERANGVPWSMDQVIRLEFEVDDQTPEEIGLALDDLRGRSGVLDVVQYPVTGKKGRLATGIRLLVRPGEEDGLVAACFDTTTTLGIRREAVDRYVLDRESLVVSHEDREYRVKVAARPEGATAKVEIEDLGLDRNIRQTVERLALEQSRKQDG